MYKKTQETHILLKLDQSKDGILGPGFGAGKFRGFLNLKLCASGEFFFAKSDLDLSIAFFLFYFVSFKL